MAFCAAWAESADLMSAPEIGKKKHGVSLGGNFCFQLQKSKCLIQIISWKTFLNKSNIFWILSYEIYDLLPSTVSRFSSTFMMTQKGKQQNGKLVRWQCKQS